MSELSRVLSTVQVSNLLGVSTRTIERMRESHTGPVFIRVGRKVMYKSDDIEQWLLDNKTL